MLFTVNVETKGQPIPTLLRQLAPGYGVVSTPFELDKVRAQWHNSLPIESETGHLIIPGQLELELLMELFPNCICVNHVKSQQILAYKHFAWTGHILADRRATVRYTVNRINHRLDCIDVDWLCELRNENSEQTATSLTIRQRLYT